MGQTIVEKIAQNHMTEGPAGRPVRTGDILSIRPRHVMTHDNTSPVMAKFATIGAARMKIPSQAVFCLDHDIQNKSEENLRKYRAIEAFAREQGVDFYPAGSGIGHQVMCEQLYVCPGAFVVASDSHSNMYGALGALGTPIVRTDAAAVWATGEFWWQIPRTIQVHLTGTLPAGSTGKDVIITLCGLYNRGEVLNAAVEFVGPGVGTLTMDERMSVSNMTTEWGALVGWFPADKVTLSYLRQRLAILSARGIRRISEEEISGWEKNPPGPDADAAYAGRIDFDLSQVTPHVAGPDSVQIATPLAVMEEKRIRIQKAYLISCVNSRLSDIESAAAVLKDKQVAASVQLFVAAASQEIESDAKKSGAWDILLKAGARPLPPGCGPCIGLGVGLLEPEEVGISATNRNFKGRMGSREAQCYLSSPEVVAASAAAGYIKGPKSVARTQLRPRFESLTPTPPSPEKVEILKGFPRQIKGRIVFLPEDHLNTDGIYGKDYTYKDDVNRETMARVVMANYDPRFAETAREGDILVGGFNFGTGSSREQAVTALQAKGIALLVAGSFSQTYLRNAFNNGFLCVPLPDLVQRLRETLKANISAGEKTIIPGDEGEVDFSESTFTYRGQVLGFPPLGSVPQALYVAGGAENLVRQRLGLD